MKRSSISKKTRFEVFKRDGFLCHYCGNHPPAVLLHVDHITPVSSGGLNDMDNLITACEACNQGKGARSLSVIPQSLAEKSKLVAERESQLAGYQAILEAKRERISEEQWRVAEILDPGCTENGIRRDYLQSIKHFNEKLGVHEVLEAADKAKAKGMGLSNTFRYFCGICWNMIKNPQ